MTQLKRLLVSLLNRTYSEWWPKCWPPIDRAEDLYYRVSHLSILRDGRISPVAIRLPDASCLRAKFALPETALEPGCCGGERLADRYAVATVSASDLTGLKWIKKPDEVSSRVVTMQIRQKPVRGCFAHTEIGDFYLVPSGMQVRFDDLPEEEQEQLRLRIARSSRLSYGLDHIKVN